MATKEKVSGMGANSSRTDKNLSERVSKIQREAKIQNSTGGAYTNRQDLTSLAGGASTNVPSASANVSMPEASMVSSIPQVSAFAPGSGRNGIPLSDGAPGGDGRGIEAQPPTVNATNPDSIFVRAMAAANPDSRQLMMMVEAYNEMEAI
jgi:hypothetical protein